MFIFPKSGARGPQTLTCLKYYNILKWESKFTLGLKTAKNINYIKKCFKQKLFRIKITTKNLVGTYIYLSQEWRYVWNIIMYWNGKVDSLYNCTLPKILIGSKNGSNKNCLELNLLQKS